GGDNLGAKVAGDVAEDERDHADSAFHVAPHARRSAQPSGLMVKVDRRGARVVRAGVGADDPLTQVRHLEPLIPEVVFDALDHRPLKEHVPSLDIAAEPLVDLVHGGGLADPEIVCAGGSKRVAESRLDRAKVAPALDVDGRKPADLALATLVVIPKLDAAAVLKRHEQSGR